ncbi:MAG: LysM peptidoglycan-binding domain-containing protein, partial [Bacteroidia bacterium]
MRKLLFCISWALAQPPFHNPDTIALKRQVPERLSCILYKSDTLVFSAYLAPFWNTLRYSHQKKVKILYLGEESALLGYVREGLEKIFFPTFADGGVGWIFPYGLVETSPPTGYFIQEWGSWESSRQNANPDNAPLGLSGVCASTFDSTAGLRLYSQKPIQRLALLCHTPTSWQILPTHMPPIHYEPEKTFYVTLPAPAETLEFIPHPEELPATLHGILAENTQNGVIFYSVGLIENSFSSLLRNPLLKTHLRQLAPDLVIMDLGTQNIIALSDLIQLKPLLSRFVDSVQHALPGSGIVLVSPQDFFNRYVPFSEGHLVAHMYAQVAAEKKIAFWDAYHICGGTGSMRSWRLQGWAAPDLVHLLPAGYRHKGEILGAALLWGYERYLRNALPSVSDENLHLARSPIQVSGKIPLTPQLYPIEASSVTSSTAALAPSAKPMPATYHKVRQGETLSSIAQKYGTTTQNLMKINN